MNNNIYEQQLKYQALADKYNLLLKNTARKHLLKNQSDTEKDLYINNRKQWEEKYNNEIKEYMSKNSSVVAPIAVNQIKNTVDYSQNLSYMFNKDYFNKTVQLQNTNTDDVQDFYKNYSYELFESTVKSTSNVHINNIKDTSIIHTYEQRPTSISTNHLINSFKNIKDKDRLMYFDLETISGLDDIGKQKLSQITDFTFKLFDSSGKELNNYSSIIGSTEAQYQEYLSVINKIKRGEGVNNYEKVMFDRLKMTGNAKIDTSKIKDGIASFISFPNIKEVPGLDVDSALKGASLLRNIGIAQEQASLVDYNGVKVKYWEQQLLLALDTVIDNNFSIGGHNIKAFDIPMINETLYSKMQSEGAKSYVKSKYRNGFNPKYIADTLVAERLFGTLSDEQVKVAKEINSTPFTQETLVRTYFPDFYDEHSAHTSSVDVEAGAKLILQSGRYNLSESILTHSLDNTPNELNEDSIFYQKHKNKSTKINSNEVHLFYSPQGIKAQDYNVIGFSNEFFNGNYHLQNIPYSVNKNKLNEELFAQPGLQRGVAYTLNTLKEIDIDSELQEKLYEVNPKLNNQKLFSISLSPFVDKESTNLKSLSPVNFIGTKENIENLLSRLLYIAEKDINGNWNVQDIPYDTLKQLKTYTVKDKQITVNDFDRTEESINRLKQISSHNIKNEYASRARRELNYKKDSNLLKFVNALDEYVELNSTKETTDTQKKKLEQFFIKQEIEKARSIELRKRNGETIPLNEYGLIHKYLGWQTKDKTAYNIYRNTVDAAISSIDYIRANKNIIETAIKYTNEQSFSDPNIRQQTYAYFLKGLLNKAEFLHGQEAVNKKITAIPAYNFNNFEVDLNGYKNRTFQNNIFKINLNSNGYSIVDNLFKIQGIDSKKQSDYSKIIELKNFQTYLNKRHILKTEEPISLIDENKDNFSTAVTKMIKQIRDTRKLHSLSGIILNTIHHDILDNNIKNFGLSNEEINLTALELEKNKPNFFIATLSNKDLKNDKKLLDRSVHEIVDNIIFKKVANSPEEEIDFFIKHAGYDKQIAINLHNIRNLKREETFNFLKSILGSVIKTGGSFAYDNESLFIADKSNSEFIKINNLFKDVVTDSGMTYAEIGATKTAVPYGLYEVGNEISNNRSLTSGTRIAYAANSVGWASSSIEKAGKDSNKSIVEIFQRVIDQFNKTLRQTSSDSKEDMQDIKLNTRFDIKSALGFLYEMDDAGVFNDISYDKNNPNDLGNILHIFLKQRKNYSVENMDFKIINAFNQYFPELIRNGKVNKFLIQQDATSASYLHIKPIDENIASLISSIDKKAYEGMYTFFSNANYGDFFNSGSRLIQDQVSRAHSYNVEEVQNQINSGELKDSKIGPVISSESRLVQENNMHGLSYQTANIIQTRRLQLTNKDLRELIANSDINPLAKTYLNLINTHENSSAISASLASYALSDRDSIQKIALSKLAEENGYLLTRLNERKQITPKLSIENGKIKFNYSNGLFVQKGEDLACIKGWQDSSDSVAAKYTGILKYGIFAPNGKLADETTIETAINKGLTQEELTDFIQKINYANNTPNGKVSSNQIHVWNQLQKILEDSNLKTYLYVDTIDMSANIKIAQMTAEKSMAQVIAPSIGAINNNIRNVLETLMGKGSTVELDKKGKIIKRYGAEEFLSIIPNRRIIDSLLFDDLSKSDFGLIMSGFRADKKQLTHEEILKALTDNGFNSAKDFRSAILKEQNFAIDELNRFLKKSGIINKNETINLIGNTFTDEEKHKNFTSALQAYISNRLAEDDSIENKRDIVSKLQSVSKSIYLDKNNNIIASTSNSTFSIENLQKVIKEHFGTTDGYFTTDRFFYVGNGKIYSETEYNKLSSYQQKGLIKNKVEVSMSTIAGMTNWDRERIRAIDDAFGKQIKFTDRNLEVMRMHTFDQNILDITKQKLIESLGQTIGEQEYNKYFGSVNTGELIANEVINTLENNRYMIPGEQLLSRFDGNGNIVDFSIDKKENVIAIKQASEERNKLIEDGIDEKSIDAISQIARQNGARGVSSSYIRNQYHIMKFGQAKEFNDNGANSSIELAKQRGFKIISINDIVTDPNVDESLENSIYGRNILLDLHMDDVSNKHQLYTNEKNRYVALPYLSAKYLSDDYKVKSEYQQQVAKIAHKIQDFKEDYSSANLSSNDIQNFQDIIQEDLQELKTSIAGQLTQKKKLVSEASKIILGDAGIFTTSGMHLIGIEDDYLLKNLRFDNISLVEQAAKLSASQGKKGLDIAYGIASKSAYLNFYNDKYIRDLTTSLGMNEDLKNSFQEKLFNELKTGGTLSVNSRDPQDYILSSNVNALYFSEHVKGDTLFLSNSLQQAMKNDNDSDKASISILKGRANISYLDNNGNTKTVSRDIDYATYKVLSNMNSVFVSLTDEATRLFEDSKRSMLADAATIYPKYYNNDPNKRSIELDAEGKRGSVFNVSHLSDFTISGTATGNMAEASSKTYTQDERYKLSNLYSKIESNFTSSLSREDLDRYNSSSAANQRTMIRDWAVSNFKDKDNAYYQDIQNVLEYRLNIFDKEAQYNTAIARKAGAGAIDFHVHRMSTRARASGAFTGVELRDISQIRTALTEQFLSPKNENGKPDFRYIDKVQNAINEAYAASKSRNQTRIAQAEDLMFNTLNELLAPRFSKELSQLTPIVKRGVDGLALKDSSGALIYLNDDERRERAIRTYASIVRRADFSKNSDLIETSAGGSRKGVQSGTRLVVNENASNLKQVTLNEANQASSLISKDFATSIDGPKISNIEVLDNYTPDLEQSVLNTYNTEMPTLGENNVLLKESSKAGKTIENIGNKLHMGIGGFIAGIGTGILLSGYGSDPSAPAITQANDIQEQYQMQYPIQNNIPNLADSNISTNNNASPSYIINISGSSPEGQEQAIDAINSAIYSQVPLNTSINLQMNTSFADKISQLQINKLVANSLLN